MSEHHWFWLTDLWGQRRKETLAALKRAGMQENVIPSKISTISLDEDITIADALETLDSDDMLMIYPKQDK